MQGYLSRQEEEPLAQPSVKASTRAGLQRLTASPAVQQAAKHTLAQESAELGRSDDSIARCAAAGLLAAFCLRASCQPPAQRHGSACPSPSACSAAPSSLPARPPAASPAGAWTSRLRRCCACAEEPPPPQPPPLLTPPLLSPSALRCPLPPAWAARWRRVGRWARAQRRRRWAPTCRLTCATWRRRSRCVHPQERSGARAFRAG